MTEANTLQSSFSRRHVSAKLISDSEKEILGIGYAEASMKFYRRRWQMLLQFAKKCGGNLIF
jgi:hypothetical protein